jgi:hypothetical protein
MSAVNVSFIYEPGEYARGLGRLQIRRLRPARDVVAALLVIPAGLWLWSFEGAGLWGALLCGAGAALLALVVGAVIVVPWLVERMQPKLRERYDLTFADDGIHFRTTGIDSKLDWALYASWWHDDQYIYLLHGYREVTILPRRVFAESEPALAFEDLVRRHLGNARDPRHAPRGARRPTSS